MLPLPDMNLPDPSTLRRPDRDPRPNPHAMGLRHRDFAEVPQANGLAAQFEWDSENPTAGWQFACWRDSQRFILLLGADQTGEFARLLLDSTQERRREREEAERRRETTKYFESIGFTVEWDSTGTLYTLRLGDDAMVVDSSKISLGALIDKMVRDEIDAPLVMVTAVCREEDRKRSAFGQFTMPVIKSVMAGAPILTDLVSVQPMSAPPMSGKTLFKLEAVSAGPLLGKKPTPTCGPDEELHEYVYGGVLSERGGWFVTPKGDRTRVLRYRMDWLS